MSVGVTSLPDIRTDRSRIHFYSHEWPLVTGFDILGHAGDEIAKFPHIRKATIVCDTASRRLFLPTLAESLARHNIEVFESGAADIILFMGGQKTMQAAHQFAARGPSLHYALLPTTLMAQIDGAVGPPPEMPNLLASWVPPLFSLCDIALLSTLEKRHFRSNYAHAARLALAGDEELFSWLEWWGNKAVNGEIAARLVIIRKCCDLRQRLVSISPDNDFAAPLSWLGEPFARAVMKAGDFTGTLTPGEALALGIRMAFGISVRLGYCPIEDAVRMRKHLQIAGFQTGLRKSPANHALHAAEVMGEMRLTGGGVPPEGLVLARGIGKAFLSREIEVEDMAAVIDKVLSE